MTALYAAVDMNTIQTVWGRPMPLLEDANDPVGMVRSLRARRQSERASSARSSADTRATRAMPHSAEGTTALARAAKSGDAS